MTTDDGGAGDRAPPSLRARKEIAGTAPRARLAGSGLAVALCSRCSVPHPRPASCPWPTRRICRMLQIGSDRLSGAFLEGRQPGFGRPDPAATLDAQVDAASQKLPITDKSVVFVFMQGGPSQIETFDPKMTAPAGIRQRQRRDRHVAARDHLRVGLSPAGRAGSPSRDRAFVHHGRRQS